jgi:GTPase SAR1 family protein
MFNKPSKQIQERIEGLRAHLSKENPLLVEVIGSFQELDKVAYRLGLLSQDESFATRIAWWPLISILGTFSAGKSTFINQFVGMRLQETGNQAVDDKFTVICYSEDQEVRVLPGLALDADPRFPFYQISEEIEKVSAGEGGRVDTYLQLKTCPCEQMRGRIMIDSPGFDADKQRDSTLRITDYIIDLSDLVLVFFDARHPEPGAMRDTLEHLVSGTLRRNDAIKMPFILNQIDTTAKEDNMEDVVAAWQRALAQAGLGSGRFSAIYNEEAAVPIDNENLRQRYQSKKNADLGEIYDRISQMGVERSYRIIGSLENTANQIEYQAVPALSEALRSWFRKVLTFDALILVPLLGALLGLTIYAGYWDGLSFAPSGLEGSGVWGLGIVGVVLIALLVAAVHYWVRKKVAQHIARRLDKRGLVGDLAAAFLKNTSWNHTIFHRKPVGWGRFARKHVVHARQAADHFVQELNDRFTNPSGGTAPASVSTLPGQEGPSAEEQEQAPMPRTGTGSSGA